MPDKVSLKEEIWRLRHIANRLKFFSLLIIITLIACMLLSVWILISYPAYTLYIFRFVPTALSFFGIVLLFIFDSIRKSGMVLYDEISDELEWGFRTGNTVKRDVPGKRVQTAIRVAMRQFLQATDLPIVPGSAGQGIYFALFISLTIANMIIVTQIRVY